MTDRQGASDAPLIRTSEFLPNDETDLFFVTPHITKASSLVATFVLASLVCAILSLI